MTATNNDPIPPDTRSIDEMPFGSGAADPQAVAAHVRAMLRSCGVTVAHEIEELGCTGASAKGLKASEIAELRLGLGGGGVGLPCFVPPTRYCLAHSTIGGLQIGQLGRFPEEIVKISRELMPREKGQVELIEASRRVRGGDLNERLMKTADALAGRDLPPGVEMGDPGAIVEDDDGEEDLSDIVERNRQISRGWTCPEHRAPLWSCRYCVAQMIVEGPLEPSYLVASATDGGTVFAAKDAGQVEQYVEECDVARSARLTVFVRAADFSRKLARD